MYVQSLYLINVSIIELGNPYQQKLHFFIPCCAFSERDYHAGRGDSAHSLHVASYSQGKEGFSQPLHYEEIWKEQESENLNENARRHVCCCSSLVVILFL